MTPPWREAAISRRHDRAGFDCGVAALNDYLQRYARQNHESGGSKTFVMAPEAEPRLIWGYYSISPASLDFGRVPDAVTRALGRYEVPAFRLGRLAVRREMQGRGLGAQLLFLAGRRARSAAAEIGGVALAIDAKDDAAAAWYRGFGALRLLDDPLRLILPLDLIAEAEAKAAGRG